MTCRQHISSKFASKLVMLFALVPTLASAQVSVWTHHGDNARTGANLAEVQLNTSNVNASQFGKLFGYSVDAAMYAQPLVIPNVSIPGKGQRNVVYVATMNNSVYAFDADDPTADAGQPLWRANFNNAAAGITPVPSADISGNRNYAGPYGIMGTPVIDRASGTIYLVARTKENGSYFQRLHALDITTGQERSGSPATISGTIDNGDGTSVTFSPKMQNQRPALTLANGRVYISWASVEDLAPYQGWVIAYDATTLQRVAVFSTAPKGSMAGIWMSGEGPSVDANGNLYLSTGNGSWNGATNFAQSVLKLSPSLAVLDWFTPDNWSNTSGSDLDLGSSGVLLMPGTRFALTGSKEGRLFLLDTTSMGHMVAGNGQIPQLFQGTVSFGHHIHGSPVYWNGSTGQRIYIWGETDFLKAYSFNGQTFNTTPVTQSTFTSPQGMPGGILTLSANGSTSGTGILWAAMPLSQDAEPAIVPGQLMAFDATDLTKLLWSSGKCGDAVGSFAKYVPPVVANGKVYLSTFSNQLLVYGLRNDQPSGGGGLVGSVACNSTSVNLTAVGTADWAKWPNYVHKATGQAQISNYSVLGSSAVQTYTNDPRTLSWSDGTPTVSGSDRAGVLVTGNKNGFRITAPADTTTRTLYVYVEAFNSSGQLTAHLSDNSAPDYVNTLSASSQLDAVYTITYSAASAGQQLVVSWTQDSDVGNVALQGAALTGPTSAPSPPTNVSASDGTSTTSVTIMWTASANATTYTVYRSASAGPLGTSIGATNSTTLTDTTVTPGVTYYYSVVAAGPGGTSAPSAQDPGFAAATQGGGTVTSFAAVGSATSAAAIQTTTNAAAPPGSSASLVGSSVISSATVNLTTAGSTDWIKWPNGVHKTTGGSQISMAATVGRAAVQTYTNDPRTVTWSDGAPTASGTDQAGILVSGVGTGFLVTAPADTNSRTLSLYVGGFNSSGMLIAHLSDGSAPDYVVTTTPVASQYDLVYTITYRAASSGKQLSLNWTQVSGPGNVTLQAAALK